LKLVLPGVPGSSDWLSGQGSFPPQRANGTGLNSARLLPWLGYPVIHIPYIADIVRMHPD